MVLGIANRTENWKTAYIFAPYFRDSNARLRLVERLGETHDVEDSEVHLELFWKGTRDYLHCKSAVERPQVRDSLLGHCAESFGSLREKVCNFKGLQCFKEFNYDVSSESTRERLYQNILHTEIDIVIETPNSLFIGEAKHEETFGARSNRILVHQLIRQYVMASVLLKTRESKKQVIPFVVGDDVVDIKKKRQVQFMICQGWMEDRNVMGWKDVAAT